MPYELVVTCALFSALAALIVITASAIRQDMQEVRRKRANRRYQQARDVRELMDLSISPSKRFNSGTNASQKRL